MLANRNHILFKTGRQNQIDLKTRKSLKTGAAEEATPLGVVDGIEISSFALRIESRIAKLPGRSVRIAELQIVRKGFLTVRLST